MEKMSVKSWQLGLKMVSFKEKSSSYFKNFGLRPSKPSAAEAVAECEKPSATAVDLRPSVDRCLHSTIFW